MRLALPLLVAIIPLASLGLDVRNASAQTKPAEDGAAATLSGGPTLEHDQKRATTASDAPQRRSGIVFGLTASFGLAGSSGYPNSASKIDDPNFYSQSDLLTGSGGTFFLMGAIADYVNFGFWLGGATYQSKDWRSTGGGGGLRVELFPLYSLVPKLKDLGILGQFGFGSTKLTAKNGDYPPAVATQSMIATGAFYDFHLWNMLGGHVAGGPNLEYDAIFSRSAERHGATVGFRIAFYGGP